MGLVALGLFGVFAVPSTLLTAPLNLQIEMEADLLRRHYLHHHGHPALSPSPNHQPAKHARAHSVN